MILTDLISNNLFGVSRTLRRIREAGVLGIIPNLLDVICISLLVQPQVSYLRSTKTTNNKGNPKTKIHGFYIFDPKKMIGYQSFVKSELSQEATRMEKVMCFDLIYNKLFGIVCFLKEP